MNHVTIRRSLRAAFAVLLAAWLSIPALVNAQAVCGDPACPTQTDLESARGLALGSGVRASSASTSALAYNPAGLALGKVYHIEGQFDYLAEMNTIGLGASVVDSSTTIVGAGFSFRGFLTAKDGATGLDGKLGLALPLGDMFAVGIAGRYVQLKRDTTVLRDDGAGALEEVELEQQLLNGFSMDASILVRPIDSLSIAVLAQNFINMDSPYAPLLLGGSVSLGFLDSFVLGGDFLTDLSTFADPSFLTGFGLEYLAGGMIPLRAGYQYDTGRKQHSIGAGLGYTDQRIGLDLSLDQGVNGPLATRVMFAFRYFVN